MPLVNSNDLLQHAYQHHYAVAGIGITDLELAQAALEAAEQVRSPVVFNLLSDNQAWLQPATLLPSLLQLAKQAKVPVAVHCDHLASVEAAKHAIALGCNSVMVELDSNSLPAQVDQLQGLQTFCRQAGIGFEVSAGHTTEEGNFTTDLSAQMLTQPANVHYLATKLQPTAISISIGNEHGKLTKTPKIDLARLRKIHQETKIPLVLHGGSGLTNDQCLRLVKKGVAKINFFSDLVELAASIRAKNADYFISQQQVAEGLTGQIAEIMRLVGSAGRAAEVMQQTRLFNTQTLAVKAKIVANNQLVSQKIEQAWQDFQQALIGLGKAQTLIKNDQEHRQISQVWLLELNQQPGLVIAMPEYQKLLRVLQTQAMEVETWLN